MTASALGVAHPRARYRTPFRLVSLCCLTFAVVASRLPPQAGLEVPLKTAEEHVAADRYDEALSALAEAEKLCAKAGDPAALARVRDRKKEIGTLKAQYSKVKDAAQKLSTVGDDPEANLAYGKFLTFVKGDFERGLPHLAKGSDPFLKALAQHDTTSANPGLDTLAIGNAWATGSAEIKADFGLTGAVGTAKVRADPEFVARARQRMTERALHWWAKAWPSLPDGPQKAQLRDSLKKVLQNPAAPDVRGLRDAQGWTSPHREQNAGPSARAAHSGRLSWQVTCGKNSLERYTSLHTVFPAHPGAKYEFSGWVLTDGTEAANDEINLPVFSADGKLLLHPLVYMPVDSPFWSRLSTEFVCPEGASRVSLGVIVTSRKGVIFLDDLSLKCNGKELLHSPGFEHSGGK